MSMEAITKKYLELYALHSAELQARPELLVHHREAAYDAFARQGLPRFKSEDYQRTDLPSLFDQDWQLTLLEGSPYWASQAFAPGIFVGSLSDFVRLYPEVAAEHYARIAPATEDGLVALNTLFTADGLVVYLPKGSELPGHIELRSILPRQAGHLSIERALIIVEDDAKVALYYEDCPEEVDGAAMTLRTMEVYVGRRASFTLVDREESNASNIRISSTYIRQMKDSHVDVSGVTLSNGTTRNNFFMTLAEEQAELKIQGLALNSGASHTDNFSFIAHAVPHCTSDELFKYVLQDQSRGVFTGRILVAQDAQKTQAYQNNRNLLLSKDARMQSKPQLEIYADDVKCSHGMTTGQLSADALFYMRQRGISLEEARLMLSNAFAEDVLARIPIEELAEVLRQRVEERLRK